MTVHMTLFNIDIEVPSREVEVLNMRLLCTVLALTCVCSLVGIVVCWISGPFVAMCGWLGITFYLWFIRVPIGTRALIVHQFSAAIINFLQSNYTQPRYSV